MKKYLLILVGFIALNTNAQQQPIKEIPVSFDIFLDNKKIETDSVLIGSVYDNTMKTYTVVNDTFTSYLLPNKTYNIVISHPNYNKKMLRIITDNNITNKIKIDVYLSSKAPDSYIGYYKYNKILKRYIQYE